MRKTWLTLLAILIAGVGCSLPAPLQEPGDTPIESVEVPVESVDTPIESIETPVESAERGLQWETDVAAHPPAPQSVVAVAQETGVRIAWEKPVAVETPHSYSDTIVHYRVFRRLASSRDATEIGTTDQLYFVDSDPPAGLAFYHVTAIHEGDAESGRSDEADVVLGSE